MRKSCCATFWADLYVNTGAPPPSSTACYGYALDTVTHFPHFGKLSRVLSWVLGFKSKEDFPKHQKRSLSKRYANFPADLFLSPFQHLQTWGNKTSRCCQGGAMTLAQRIKPFPWHCSPGPLCFPCWGGCFGRMLRSKSPDMGANWAFWTVTSKLATSSTNEGVHFPETSIGIYQPTRVVLKFEA